MIHFLELIWPFKADRLLDLPPTLEVSGAYNIIWMKLSSTRWVTSENESGAGPLWSWVLIPPTHHKRLASETTRFHLVHSKQCLLRLTVLKGVLFQQWALLLSVWKCEVSHFLVILIWQNSPTVMESISTLFTIIKFELITHWPCVYLKPLGCRLFGMVVPSWLRVNLTPPTSSTILDKSASLRISVLLCKMQGVRIKCYKCVVAVSQLWYNVFHIVDAQQMWRL